MRVLPPGKPYGTYLPEGGHISPIASILFNPVTQKIPGIHGQWRAGSAFSLQCFPLPKTKRNISNLQERKKGSMAQSAGALYKIFQPCS